jgi:glutathione peroxidase-family protein
MLEVFKSDINTEFIFPDPASPVAYYVLMLSINGQMLYNPQGDRQDAKCFAAVATQMDINYPDAVRTKHLHNVAIKGMARTSTARNAVSEEDIKALEDLITESGLIEIDLPDCHGVNHKLSDLKGQVVLIDFTAYKTDYSINYNFMLRTLYDKYADQGFNIYQVSVDTDESMWMNSSSNLPWVCVRDEASLQSNYLKLYNVTQIPTVFLVDRNGDIVDRPEDTNSLDSKIAALLGKK